MCLFSDPDQNQNNPISRFVREDMGSLPGSCNSKCVYKSADGKEYCFTSGNKEVNNNYMICS